MVRPRESREKRLCLACGGSTRVSHLGVDLCRACAVFHRRSLTRNYVCRSRTDNTKECRCRKCRFTRIGRLIAVAPLTHNSAQTVHAIPKECRHSSTFTPLISKLSECYRVMCETRLVAELSARSTPSHPLEMNDKDFIPSPATPSALNDANRVFLSAILNFGNHAFPEFSRFNEAEKWKLATNFFHRFRLFEGGYRADKKFTHDLEISFGSYTMYVSENVAKSFYEDDIANRMMAASLRKDLRPNRERFRRLKLHNEEFIVVLAMMFWKTDELELSDSVLKTSARYRREVLAELHYFYKNVKALDDYARRLGEILLFIYVYSRLSTEMNHKSELLRLANVFTEETVLYHTAEK